MGLSFEFTTPINKMDFFIVGLGFLICNVYAKLEVKPNLNDCLEGYYWREYRGDIPRDAVPGGLDGNGNLIYIGQVLHGEHLFPGQIRQVEKSVIYYDSGHIQRTTTKYIKILCTQRPENFDWIKTNNSNIKDLTKKHLILGGYYQNIEYTVYIGRLSINGEILVGMILVCDSNELGLHLVGNGEATTYKAYEVLSYNPRNHVNTGCEKPVLTADETISDNGEGKCPQRTIQINIKY